MLGVAAGVAATAALVQWKWQEITRAGDQLVLLWASRRKGVAAAQVCTILLTEVLGAPSCVQPPPPSLPAWICTPACFAPLLHK